VRRIVPTLLLLTTVLCLPRPLIAQQDMGDGLEARRLLQEAGRLIRDIPEAQQPSAVANVAGQLTRAGDLADALSVVQLLRQPQDLALANGIIAWHLANSGNFSQALAIVEASGISQTFHDDYETLAALAARKGNVGEALEIAHRTPQNSVARSEALRRVAEQVAKAGELPRASQIVGEALEACDKAILDNGDSALELAQIAGTQAEIGDKSGAYATLSKLSNIAHRTGSDASMLLQQLASAQARMGDLVGAQRTMDELPPARFDGVLVAISEEQAKQGLMADAIASSARISNSVLRSIAFRELAVIRGTHGALNDALEAIDKIPDPSSRAEALAVLALEQAENDNPAANQTVQLAWSQAVSTGADAARHALGEIAVTRATLNDFAGAQQIVYDMADQESRVWPLWSITSMMVSAGHKQEALALAENENAAYPKAYALLGTATGILDRLEAERKARAEKH
jgi:tetratricopeptide (TPR) repeat protein